MSDHHATAGRPRRARGTGSLIVRTEKAGGRMYYGQWRVGDRQVRRRIGPVRPRGTRQGLTRAQAEAALRRLIVETTPEQVEPATRVNLEEAGAAYLAHVEAKGRKATTVQDYEIILRRHLVPFFGSGALSRVKVDDVEQYVNTKSQTLAVNSLTNHVNLLHAVFDYGRHPRRRWVRSNPVAELEIRPSPEHGHEIAFLSSEELEALLRAVPDDLEGLRDRSLYATAAWAGLRQGEAAALRWQDVDFVAMKIRVRWSLTRGQLTTPKTRRSIRAVPMSERLGAELDGLHRGSAFTGSDDLVFGHPETGHHFDASHVRRRFQAALGRAQLRPVRFHDLRHSYGTAMAAAGCPMFELAGYMGHASVTTTEKHYAAWAPDEARGAIYAERAFAPVTPTVTPN